MALLHRAEMRPTKLDLLAAWLPTQSWCDAPAGTGVERVAAYRFDDPANAVGIETILVRAGDGVLYQAPLTYRGAPLAGGEQWLVGTAEHSVLGRRWIFDGCGDPVYRAALAGALAGEVPQADEYIEVDGELIMRERSMTLTSAPARDSGQAGEGATYLTRVADDPVELILVRRPGAVPALPGTALLGSWNGQETPLALAYAGPR